MYVMYHPFAFQALRRIASDGRLVLMAVVQVLFEGAMSVWIHMWAPCLEQEVCACVLYDVCVFHVTCSKCWSVVPLV